MGEPAAATSRRSRRHHWLLLLPFVWQVGLVPFANEVVTRPFGLPFAMVWQMLGILVATGVIAIVFGIDRRQEDDISDRGDGTQ
jgi:hypothetical protein